MWISLQGLDRNFIHATLGEDLKEKEVKTKHAPLGAWLVVGNNTDTGPLPPPWAIAGQRYVTLAAHIDRGCGV